ncbi:hypothetical protein BBOV_III000130 [Babesia bovis T2Bo]|uniref:BCNT-C domain-containing protein n=1 Tax=Babesia bovis TaxID=5865 RepID=A7ALZ8_BABBO|nr:hypothetical protein BBOV_III000130 [Babesia bovis T2Bo]EDO07582.1 hypothetical protein BBOV_III000130 [Babesia bovis T2Bo]BAN66133.1 conserved hypothetical protein [Babesia bovis]|eukprot:XP_001611150.1 hypothetical protein [Babesia bovis T2Bo]
MATILTMQLPSDDECDSDYVTSEHSSDDEGNTKRGKRKIDIDAELSSRRRTWINNASTLFEHMLQDSELTYRHRSTVDKSDYMLQFHKKDASSTVRKNGKLSELERYITLNCSRISNENKCLNLRTFKASCRNIPDSDKLKQIQEAVLLQGIPEKVTITKTYRFAGKMHTIKEHVAKMSRRYKQYVMSKQQTIGGSLAFIDDAVSELDKAPKISAIKKSEADWHQYKDDEGIDINQEAHKFLKNEEFLDRATMKEHTVNINARKQ